MANDNSNDKQAVLAMLAELLDAEPGEVRTVLEKCFDDDAVFRVFHPFNERSGLDAMARVCSAISEKTVEKVICRSSTT